jgi:hypothetical protein
MIILRMCLQMLIEQSDIKLLSLLLVFLSENYSTSTNRCNSCEDPSPRFGKSFLINGEWICVDCVLDRIQTGLCK